MAVAQKKIPMRQCLGCREHKPKRELVRVVRSPEGEVSLTERPRGLPLPQRGLPAQGHQVTRTQPRLRHRGA